MLGSSRSNLLLREGLIAAKRKAKEKPREKVAGGGTQRLWRVTFYRGGKPYHFLFLRFFDWTPRSRDIDCQSSVKNSDIIAADILSTPIFLGFLA